MKLRAIERQWEKTQEHRFAVERFETDWITERFFDNEQDAIDYMTQYGKGPRIVAEVTIDEADADVALSVEAAKTL